MRTETVALFFALVLLGGTLAVLVAATRGVTRTMVRDAALLIGALVAVGATGGSLYLSEVAGFVPCELCWFQRILMYPMAILLPIAAVRDDRSMCRYGMVLALVGLVISAYHVQIQLFPDQGSVCDLDNPCSARWVEVFGWLTIPQLAGISFALIAGVMALASFGDGDADLVP